jgi:hypothetical protein
VTGHTGLNLPKKVYVEAIIGTLGERLARAAFPGGDVMTLGNADTTFVCQECGHRNSGPSITSISGRRLCAACADRLSAATARLLTLPSKEFDGTTHADAWFEAQRVRRARTDTVGSAAVEA